MNYNLNKNVMTDDKTRISYDALAQKTFGLSFEDWYQKGFWSATNQPYTLFDGDKAVANVSINRMDVEYEGRVRKYIQLGTVMTDEAYRNQGLARYLMEQVLSDWQENCDTIFLFANESVLDFYPKFGFEKAKQYAFRMKVTDEMQDSRQGEIDVNTGLRKLDMSDAGDIAFFEKVL